MTPEQKAIFIAHYAAGKTIQQAADAANIHYATTFRHRKKDPVFNAMVEAARDVYRQAENDEFIKDARDGLKKRVKEGQSWAIQYILSRLDKDFKDSQTVQASEEDKFDRLRQYTENNKTHE